jgi:hypothetical protein
MPSCFYTIKSLQGNNKNLVGDYLGAHSSL